MLNKKGIIVIKNQINDYCTVNELSGLCSTIDCFKCKNADYRIFTINGNIIREFKEFDIREEKVNITKYLIEFFDGVDYDNIENYLQNEYSDYRLTRLNDLAIIRRALNDIEKEENDLIKKNLINENNFVQDTQIEEVIREDNKTMNIKKLVKRIMGRC